MNSSKVVIAQWDAESNQSHLEGLLVIDTDFKDGKSRGEHFYRSFNEIRTNRGSKKIDGNRNYISKARLTITME
jgi:hypothetical protein